ncbi:hypothetical protein BKA69DRAFT_154649 [Paraphysoderma sedebokerense]|nr:hypothetical protein BKA69DRAFT_154649 [Paraphysoderma sedebokerense]
MVKFKSRLLAIASVLVIAAVCSVWAQNPVPWFLANVATAPLSAADAVIIDAVFNNTHLVVLDSYFKLRLFTYTSTSASLYRTMDISGKMGQGIVGSLYPTNRYDKTAALGINPTTGEIFVAV